MKTQSETILQALLARLHEQAKRYHPALESAPTAILWTDEKREWEALIPQIKTALPELFSLGAYSPEERTGPGVWLRMVADRQAGEVGAGVTPILYLPGVGNGQLRADLRGLKDDPHLAPLAELQYRGTFWRQENSKDWTPRAFLESKRGGLGLKVVGNQETVQALKAAMGKLLNQNLPSLEHLTIDERYLDDLINPSPDETVLRWLTAPEAIQEEKGEAWVSFVATTRTRFGVDLGRGVLVVAQKILASQPGEAAYPLWEKYGAHWQSYPDAYEVFRNIAPPDLFQGADRYPRENEADEKLLAQELLKAASMEPKAAAFAVLAQEDRHAARRETLWAAQGHAPLAMALADLAVISVAFLEPLTGGNVLDAAWHYAESGWEIDAAARAAMAIAQQADLEKPIYAVLAVLYRRWLEKQAEGFQALVKRDGYPHWGLPAVPDGVVVLFVDGLRFDLARELEMGLLAEGLTTQLEPGFTSIPSVTSSGKVWVSPACKSASSPLPPGEGPGVRAPQGFEPRLPKGAYTADKLRRAMEGEVFSLVDCSDPSFAYGKGWAEFSGDIDGDGHNKGLRLARAVSTHLEDLARAIRRLLAAAWKEVWVVSDHGWLLLPGGLPKVELPAKLTETKWGRCAVLKDASGDQDMLVLPWSFDPAVRVALAPGISAFSSGREYDHGGLSLQESVVPFLRVQRKDAVAGLPRFLSVSWNTRKTICSVALTPAPSPGGRGEDSLTPGPSPGGRGEYRVAMERLGTAIGEAEGIGAEGKARVIFEEVDDLIGEQVLMVLYRDGLKVAEERLIFGEVWNGA